LSSPACTALYQAAALAVSLRALDPAAVFLAEILGDVRDIDAFVGKEVR
jgi:hypothetical protein